jgi:hypothetical protein
VKTVIAVGMTAGMTVKTATAVEMIAEMTAMNAVEETTAERKVAAIAVRKVAPTENLRLLPVDVARPALLVNVEDRTLRSVPSRPMLVKACRS